MVMCTLVSTTAFLGWAAAAFVGGGAGDVEVDFVRCCCTDSFPGADLPLLELVLVDLGLGPPAVLGLVFLGLGLGLPGSSSFSSFTLFKIATASPASTLLVSLIYLERLHSHTRKTPEMLRWLNLQHRVAEQVGVDIITMNTRT